MKRIILLYCLLILTVFTVASMLEAKTPAQFLITLLFIPPVIYFYRLLTGQFSRRSGRQTPSHEAPSALENTLSLYSSSPLFAAHDDNVANNDTPALEPEMMSDPEVSDMNRRLFLKLIGGAGVSAFLFSIFTDKAQASFFGSMPVPGAMTVKDSAGNAIDPAEKQSTDGYEISEIDDTSSATYQYYGFVHKTGAWYISREESNGSYRYARGGNDFTTAWANHDQPSMAYGYFDNVF